MFWRLCTHVFKDKVIITVAVNLFSGLKLAVMSPHGPNPIKANVIHWHRKLNLTVLNAGTKYGLSRPQKPDWSDIRSNMYYSDSLVLSLNYTPSFKYTHRPPQLFPLEMMEVSSFWPTNVMTELFHHTFGAVTTAVTAVTWHVVPGPGFHVCVSLAGPDIHHMLVCCGKTFASQM